jgi:2-polyprenyl-3-methyl-5-hydroxy-6-metoxy-1,4-benzoquinol methylase
MDVYGTALEKYHQGQVNEKLWLETSYGETEEMPLEVFFRGKDDLPDLETFALDICHGTVLDIGAGVGSHSLILQESGLDVTALEISSIACTIMKERKIKKVVTQNIFSFDGKTFDTLLLLMNGIGLVGTIERLRTFLQHAKRLIKPGGQLLFDSSDISYLYEAETLPTDAYFGELSYRYKYKDLEGDWFEWLYIDQERLLEESAKLGWTAQIIYEDENDHFLARLILL